jgi:lysophospholipase L1-like esterase
VTRRGCLGLALMAALPASAAASTACPSVEKPPIRAPRLAAGLARGAEVRIVALGSSSTAGAGSSRPWRAYPARVLQMIGRMETDVIAEAPDLVVWQLGANAALRGMDPERFRSHLLAGLARLRLAGIDVVLMDNQRAPRIAARPGHDIYDTILAEAAASQPGVALFSRGRLMDQLAGLGVPNESLLSSDGLHHNDRGYACIAEALARTLVAGMAPAR